jgi:hypothetical protein
MARGKKLKCPKVKIEQPREPRFPSQSDAAEAVIPILARIIAQAMKRERS